MLLRKIDLSVQNSLISVYLYTLGATQGTVFANLCSERLHRPKLQSIFCTLI